MSEHDKRHGKTAGYHAGCRCDLCSLAMRRYWKLLRVNAEQGRTLRVPNHSLRRRVEALMAMGWTAEEIAERAGWANRNDVIRLRTIKWAERKTFETIAAVYEQMSMAVPPNDGRYRTRQRNHAARNGWVVPLMWDDIDRDPEPATSGRSEHNYAAAELVAEWDHLRRAGESIDQAARQLGVTVGAIEKALERVGKVSAA